MRKFYVCVFNHGNGKSAVIEENEQVIAVLDCEGLTNTEILREYSSAIKELVKDDAARIVTNHERIKRKYHRSEFINIEYIGIRMRSAQIARYYQAACEWTDKQDKKLNCRKRLRD